MPSCLFDIRVSRGEITKRSLLQFPLCSCDPSPALFTCTAAKSLPGPISPCGCCHPRPLPLLAISRGFAGTLGCEGVGGGRWGPSGSAITQPPTQSNPFLSHFPVAATEEPLGVAPGAKMRVDFLVPLSTPSQTCPRLWSADWNLGLSQIHGVRVSMQTGRTW